MNLNPFDYEATAIAGQLVMAAAEGRSAQAEHLFEALYHLTMARKSFGWWEGRQQTKRFVMSRMKAITPPQHIKGYHSKVQVCVNRLANRSH